MPEREVLFVISELDPVATQVAEAWGTPPSTGLHVEGAPVRQLAPGRFTLRRPVRHVHDERLDRALPPELRSGAPTIVFPSIHRSERGVRCLTTHPLGNSGPRAEVGGRPRALDPTDPPAMTDVLRRLAEEGPRVGWPATFEATHHGPELDLPAFFVEVGFGTASGPPPEAVRVLAKVLASFEREPTDRVALGIGGGHYAPHFTELALKRRWAFGHIISRHSLAEIDTATARAAWRLSPGVEGLLLTRAEDLAHPSIAGLGPRLRDSDAPPRPTGGRSEGTTPDARPSGT